MRTLLALLLLMPLAAQAEATRLDADLDGDGRPEAFALTPPVGQFVGLEVTTATESLFVPRIAFSGDLAGQEARLALSPAGSVQVLSGNGSVGRDRWTHVLTIAHRGGGLVVAGQTQAWHDTRSPAPESRCDLNYLTGEGLLVTGHDASPLAVPPPVALRDWAASAPAQVVGACGLGG